MLLSTLKSIFRLFSRRRSFLILKIVGLSLGLTAFMLIAAYVYDDLTWDDGFQNRDRIFVVRMNNSQAGETMPHHTTTSSPLGPAILRDIPQVEEMTRYEADRQFIYLKDDVPIREESASLVDPGFLKMFSVDMLGGDPNTALDRPDAVLLSEGLAKQVFGDEEPLGKTLHMGSGEALQVSGIFQAPGPKSSLQFQALRPITNWIERDGNEESWQHGRLSTFVLLQPDANLHQVNSELVRYTELLDPEEGMSYVDLMPLREVHLAPDIWIRHNENAGNRLYTWMFGSAAILVLLIAMVNYINLSTAQSLLRSKEIGLRKVIGARRSDLILQFIGESILLTLAAALIATVLIELLQPYVESIAGRSIGLTMTHLGGWGTLLGLAVFVGITSGLYPALVLSSFQPVQSLRGTKSRMPAISWMRRGLVIFQFVIAILLIISTFVVRDQLRFMQTADRGFNSAQVIDIVLPPNQETEPLENLRSRMAQVSGVIDAGLAFSMPGRINISIGTMPEGQSRPWIMETVGIDDHCLPMFDFQLVEGRFYSKEYPGDYGWEEGNGGSVLINEEAARQLGWEHPVGMTMGAGDQTATVVGVIKDFHTGSLQDPMIPVLIADIPFGYRRILVRLEPSSIDATIRELSRMISEEYPTMPVRYKFVDEIYQRYYDSERQSASLLQLFSVIALFLTLLGTLGLTVHAANRRVREIGIRKVLGATFSQVIGLMTREVLMLILVASVVAVPVSIWFSNLWLEKFAFRTQLPLWAIPLAVLATLVLAGLSAGAVGWKSANANPSESLRSE